VSVLIEPQPDGRTLLGCERPCIYLFFELGEQPRLVASVDPRVRADIICGLDERWLDVLERAQAAAFGDNGYPRKTESE